MSEPIRYTVSPLAPFPKRWKDRHGKITVMHEPIKGYVMVRRPGAFPFVLRVSEILNADKHHIHGPFEQIPAEKKVRRPTPSSQGAGVDG